MSDDFKAAWKPNQNLPIAAYKSHCTYSSVLVTFRDFSLIMSRWEDHNIMVDKVSNVANNSKNYSSFSKIGLREKIILRGSPLFWLRNVHHGYISYLMYCSDLALMPSLSCHSLAISQKYRKPPPGSSGSWMSNPQS